MIMALLLMIPFLADDAFDDPFLADDAFLDDVFYVSIDFFQIQSYLFFY